MQRGREMNRTEMYDVNDTKNKFKKSLKVKMHLNIAF